MYPDRVTKSLRLFGWTFIPVMFLTGAAAGICYNIWITPDLASKKIPMLLIALAVTILWVLVISTFASYRKSVKLNRLHSY